MKKNLKRVRRQSFTLVEVIAVLLVIAIMAAVAAPKFVSIAAEARKGVAKAGINEAKASLSVAYAKAYLAAAATSDSPTITGTDVMNASGFTSPVTFGDIVVTLTPAAGNIALATTTVDGTNCVVTGTWTVPNQN